MVFVWVNFHFHCCFHFHVHFWHNHGDCTVWVLVHADAIVDDAVDGHGDEIENIPKEFGYDYGFHLPKYHLHWEEWVHERHDHNCNRAICEWHVHVHAHGVQVLQKVQVQQNQEGLYCWSIHEGDRTEDQKVFGHKEQVEMIPWALKLEQVLVLFSRRLEEDAAQGDHDWRGYWEGMWHKAFPVVLVHEENVHEDVEDHDHEDVHTENDANAPHGDANVHVNVDTAVMDENENASANVDGNAYILF